MFVTFIENSTYMAWENAGSRACQLQVDKRDSMIPFVFSPSYGVGAADFKRRSVSIYVYWVGVCCKAFWVNGGWTEVNYSLLLGILSSSNLKYHQLVCHLSTFYVLINRGRGAECMVGQSTKMKKGLVPALNELKKPCRRVVSHTQINIMARHRSWRRGTGRMISYRLLITKGLGKAYGRGGPWRMGKIGIFVEGKGMMEGEEEELQKTWANTWIQGSGMCIVKETGYPQYYPPILRLQFPLT